MTRWKLALALTGIATIAAQADNSINLVERTDLRSNIYDDSAHQQSNNQFDVNYLRVDFKGNIFENVDYRLRLRLDKYAAKNNLEGVSDFANYAYVQPKLNDMFSVKIGKLWTYQAGWEEDNSSSDTYLFSGIDPLVNEYAVGVNPIISTEGQTLQLILTNSNRPYASNANADRFMAYGAAYQGNLGPVQPMLSFSMQPQTSWGEGYMIGAIGLKMDPKPFGGEIDFQYWNNNTGNAKYDTKYGAETFYDISGCIRLNPGPFRPQLKAFYDTYSDGSNTTETVIGFAPAIEYFPWADKDFRFHLAYTGTQLSPKSGTSLYNQQVYLGVKGSWGIK
jgi:hypothetical protein